MTFADSLGISVGLTDHDVANVYTELNAISKGVSIGVFKEDKGKGMEAQRSGAQPYVDLMGRR